MYSQENRIKYDQIPQNSHYPAIILKFACMANTKSGHLRVTKPLIASGAR